MVNKIDIAAIRILNQWFLRIKFEQKILELLKIMAKINLNICNKTLCIPVKKNISFRPNLRILGQSFYSCYMDIS